jgi:aminopeptidase N
VSPHRYVPEVRFRRATVLLLAAVLAGASLVSCSDDETAAPSDASDASTPTSEVFDPDAGRGTPSAEEVGEAPPGATDLDDPYTPGAGSEGIDVQHHDLDLAWDPDTGELAGIATLTVRADEPLDLVSFDLASTLEVADVQVDDADTPFAQGGDELVLEPAEPLTAGQEAEVVITYAGEPGPLAAEASLGDIGWIGDGDVAYVASQPYGASSWYPTNDHPSDKATYDLHFEVPSGLAAASNGDLVAHDDDGTTATWEWTVEQPMAAYLATVAIGDLVLVETEGPDRLPLTSFYPADQPELADEFADMGPMISVLAALFGPYPFGSYGAIVVPDELGFALETQNRPLYGTDVVDEGFRVHELAHQWFGNSVTPERWEDLWLNEGFATYAEWLWYDATDPSFDIDARAAQVADDPETAEGPIYAPETDDLFSFAVYDRGAATVHALRGELGDEAFFALVQEWVATNEGGTVSTDDFIALAEQRSGRNLTTFFDQWLDQEPYPA